MHFILLTLLGVNTLYLIYHLMDDEAAPSASEISEQADDAQSIRLLGEGKSASADYLSSLRTQHVPESTAAEAVPQSNEKPPQKTAPAPKPKSDPPMQQATNPITEVESTQSNPVIETSVQTLNANKENQANADPYLDQEFSVSAGPVAKPLAEVGVDSLAAITAGAAGSSATPFATASPTQTRLCLKVGPIGTESKASALLKSLRLMDFDASLQEGEWQRAEDYRVIVKAPAEAASKEELESSLKAAGFRPEVLSSGKFAGSLQVGQPETRAEADRLQNQTIESGFPAEIYVETRISMDYFVLVAKGQSLENPQETVKTFGYPEKSIKISFDGCKTFATSQ